MWHVSVRFKSAFARPEAYKILAHEYLRSAGAPERGEWEEWGEVTYHLRRRISAGEEDIVGAKAVDLRGTDEGWKRYRKIMTQLSPDIRRWAEEELGGKNGSA